MWGGVVPDALSALVRLLASLHDDDGNVAVAGLHEATAADVDYHAGAGPRGRRPARRCLGDRLRLCAATALGQAGDHRHRHRHHARSPQSSNTLIPRARAKVSMRVAPGGDARRAPGGADAAPRAARAVGRAGHRHAGRRRPAVRDRRQRAGLRRGAARPSGRLGATTPVDTGVGGSIPFIAEFAAAFPDGEDPGHRRRGPCDTGAQHQREPAPRACWNAPRPPRRCCWRSLRAQTDRSRRSLATWPVARTLYCASAILPFSSTTNVERMTP